MADTLIPAELMTAEEFYDYCAGREGRMELVEGRVIEMPPVGPRHGSLDTRLARRIGGFVEDQRIGDYFLNTGFILQRDPDLVRGPDQAFVSAERMNACPAPQRGFWPVAPDLTVEIVSPGDDAQDLNDKVDDYLRAGVRLVWVFYPNRRQVHVYRGRCPVEILERHQTLSGEDVLSGFQLTLSEVW